MEKMPYRAELDVQTFEAPAAAPVVSSDWRQQLPVLTGRLVRLRELRRFRRAVALRAPDDRRSGALHLAAADDG